MSVYAAYGLNLNSGQMLYRCPDAYDLGMGQLQNKTLAFRLNRLAQTLVTVEDQDDVFVPVRLWKMEPWDEETLDHFEGRLLHPPIYRRENVIIETAETAVEAFIYVLNESNAPYGVPLVSYANSVMRGYRECGFDLEPIRQALLASGVELATFSTGRTPGRIVR